MRNFICVLFLSLYAMAFIKPVVPFIEYAVNKDFIAKVLCINKDKPQMNCEGKCHLEKQLKKAEEETQNNKPVTVNLTDNIVALVHANSVVFKVYGFLLEKNEFFLNHYSFNAFFKVFHPPKSWFSII